MFRALVWKEWRQLRLLRFAGFALGVVLPLAFLAGASAARRGFAPFGRVGGDPTRTILLEILPAALGWALWPLAALLVASQAFAGDRAAGFESFLLERPVPRARTWGARLLTSVGSTLAVAASTGLVWVLFSWLEASPTPSDWLRSAQFLGAGAILTALAFAGAVGSAVTVAAPLAAVLLGLLLAALPVALAVLLGSRFHAAALRGVPIGAILPWILVPALFLASYAASCRGEPAGRGRLLRWGGVLGAAAALVIVGFVLLAPLFVRLEAARLDQGASVVASRTTSVALVTSRGNGGGWVVDVRTGKKRRFVPPPAYIESAWSADGKTLAVVTASGPLGGVEEEPRVEFLDEGGLSVGKTARIPGAGWWDGVRWAGDQVVLRSWRDRQAGLVVVDPATGEARETDVWQNPWGLGLVGPTCDGRLFVAVRSAGAPSARGPTSQSEAQEPVEYGVHRLDVKRARIEPDPVVRDTGRPWAIAGRLSPSGRYWFVDRGARRCEPRPLLDLKTGTTVPPEAPSGAATWLDGDRLAWSESDGRSTWLLLGRPGDAPAILRGWKGTDIALSASPDRKLLLVRTVEPRKEPLPNESECRGFHTPALESVVPDGKLPEARAYEVASGRWIELPWWSKDGQQGSEFARIWAGARTLARTGPGFFALEDLDRPGTVRDVIGHAPD